MSFAYLDPEAKTNKTDGYLTWLAAKLDVARQGKRPRSIPDQKNTWMFSPTETGFKLHPPMGKAVIEYTGEPLTTDQMSAFMRCISNYAASPGALPKQHNPVPATKPQAFQR